MTGNLHPRFKHWYVRYSFEVCFGQSPRVMRDNKAFNSPFGAGKYISGAQYADDEVDAVENIRDVRAKIGDERQRSG